MEPEFVNAEQVGRALGVSGRQIRDLAVEGAIPAVRVGAAWRFPVDAVAAALTTDEDLVARIAAAIRSMAAMADDVEVAARAAAAVRAMTGSPRRRGS